MCFMRNLVLLTLGMCILSCTSSEKVIEKILHKNYTEAFKVVEEFHRGDYVLIELNNTQKSDHQSLRKDYVLINKKQKEIVLKKTINSGSIEWYSDDELKITEYPNVPVGEDYNPTKFYNITTKKTRK